MIFYVKICFFFPWGLINLRSVFSWGCRLIRRYNERLPQGCINRSNGNVKWNKYELFFFRISLFQIDFRVFMLESVNILRKYSGLLDGAFG